MSDKRRRRRRASGGSSEEDDGESLSGVSSAFYIVVFKCQITGLRTTGRDTSQKDRKFTTQLKVYLGTADVSTLSVKIF